MKILSLLEEVDPDTIKARKWLKDHWDSIGSTERLDNSKIINGELRMIGDSLLLRKIKDEIPFPIGDNLKYIGINDSTLESFKNFPNKIDRVVLQSTKVKSFDGFPKEISELALDNVVDIDFSGLEKCLKRMYDDGTIRLTAINKIKGMLIPMKINGFRGYSGGDRCSDDIVEAAGIVNHYVGSSSKGVINAQRELIKKDLEDFA